jgi:hypothetical protein
MLFPVVDCNWGMVLTGDLPDALEICGVQHQSLSQRAGPKAGAGKVVLRARVFKGPSHSICTYICIRLIYLVVYLESNNQEGL